MKSNLGLLSLGTRFGSNFRLLTWTALTISTLLMTPAKAQTPTEWSPATHEVTQGKLIDTLPGATLTDKMRYFLKEVSFADRSLASMSQTLEKTATMPQSVEIRFVSMEEFDKILGNKNTTNKIGRSGASCRIRKEDRKDWVNTRDLFLVGIEEKDNQSVPDLGGTLINEFTSFLDVFAPKSDGKSVADVWPDGKTITKITLSVDDGNYLAHAWLLEWISSIAETVTTWRLKNPHQYQEKTYDEIAQELIDNMKFWKFRHDDPPGYADTYLREIISQFFSKDFAMSETLLKKLSLELIERIEMNHKLLMQYLQAMRVGIKERK